MSRSKCFALLTGCGIVLGTTFSGRGAIAATPAPVDIPASPISLSDRLPLPSHGIGEPMEVLPSVDHHTVSHLVLHLSERRLYAYRGDRLLTDYEVAIGRDGWETPTGNFSVFQLRRHPAWQHPFTGEVVPPGEDNPLGARWIGFWTDGTNAIGFHGTPQAHLVGQAVSHGCVRLRNEDVIDLFDRVALGTAVVVVP